MGLPLGFVDVCVKNKGNKLIWNYNFEVQNQMMILWGIEAYREANQVNKKKEKKRKLCKGHLGTLSLEPTFTRKKTSCVQKIHVSNESMFCIETTSDADNCLKRSQRSKQANKQQSFIDSSVKSDFIFGVMIHNKTYAVTVSRGADLETPPRVSESSRHGERNTAWPADVGIFILPRPLFWCQ